MAEVESPWPDYDNTQPTLGEEEVVGGTQMAGVVGSTLAPLKVSGLRSVRGGSEPWVGGERTEEAAIDAPGSRGRSNECTGDGVSTAGPADLISALAQGQDMGNDLFSARAPSEARVETGVSGHKKARFSGGGRKTKPVCTASYVACKNTCVLDTRLNTPPTHPDSLHARVGASLSLTKNTEVREGFEPAGRTSPNIQSVSDVSLPLQPCPIQDLTPFSSKPEYQIREPLASQNVCQTPWISHRTEIISGDQDSLPQTHPLSSTPGPSIIHRTPVDADQVLHHISMPLLADISIPNDRLSAAHLPTTFIPQSQLPTSLTAAPSSFSTSASSPVVTSSPDPSRNSSTLTGQSQEAYTVQKRAPGLTNSLDQSSNPKADIGHQSNCNGRLNGYADTLPPELCPSNGLLSNVRSPVPIGGVKVLPSIFTFNLRRFKEPKSKKSTTKEATNRNESPPSSKDDPTSAFNSAPTSAPTSTPTSTITSAPTSVSFEASTESVSILSAHQIATFVSEVPHEDSTPPAPVHLIVVPESRQSGEDCWSHYAVPSELKDSKDNTDATRPTDRKSNTCSFSRPLQQSSHAIDSITTEADDIYAIPIPRNQRQAGSSSPGHRRAKEMTSPILWQQPTQPIQSKQPTQPIQSQQPTQPIQSQQPTSARPHEVQGDTFEEVTLKLWDIEEGNMKKSRTTETMDLSSDDFFIASDSKFDYFSLGRRPKKSRVKTLTDSQGMAVSLDVLLKARRQSIVDVSSSTAPSEQTLSIDDILKSCLEFEEDNAFYRARTNSDSVKNTYMDPLLFSQMAAVADSSFEAKKLQSTTEQQKAGKDPSQNTLRKTENIDEHEEGDVQDIQGQLIQGKSASTRRPDKMVSYILINNQLPKEDVAKAVPACSVGHSPTTDVTAAADASRLLFKTPSATSTDHLPSLVHAAEGVCSRVASSDTVQPPVFKHDPNLKLPPPEETSTQDNTPSRLSSQLSSSSTAAVAPEGNLSCLVLEPSSSLLSPASEAPASSPLSTLSPSFSSHSSGSGALPSPEVMSPSPSSHSSGSGALRSPEVLSQLSVEVADVIQLGDSPSPTRRSQGSSAKLETAEALKWLRAAGFPQYAQMFEDGQFPVDMGVVERDHDFLDKDSLQSLFRRLEALNKYAGMKLEPHQNKKVNGEEDYEDDFCALSERWEYQKSARRWSRKDLNHSSQRTGTSSSFQKDALARAGSHDSLLADQDSGSQAGDSPLLESRVTHHPPDRERSLSDMTPLVFHQAHAATEISPDQSDSTLSPRLRRAASERMKSAKSLFKKMEGLKQPKGRRQSNNKGVVEISGPVMADSQHMQTRLDRLNCVDISHTSETLPRLSPTPGSISGYGGLISTETVGSRLSPGFGVVGQTSPHSLRPCSDFVPKSTSSDTNSPTRPVPESYQRGVSPVVRRDSSFDEYRFAHSTFLQNLQSAQGAGSGVVKKNNSDTNLMEIFLVPQDHQPGRFPRMLQNGYIETESCGTAVNVRTGSVRLGRGTGLTSGRNKGKTLEVLVSERLSVYDNMQPADSGKKSGDVPDQKVADVSTTAGLNGNETTMQPALTPDVCVDPRILPAMPSESRDSSVARTIESESDKEDRITDHERSRSTSIDGRTSSEFSSSHLTRLKMSEEESEAGGVLLRRNRDSSVESASSGPRMVTHSSSLDSYFRSDSDESPEKCHSPEACYQHNSEEFDRILQELDRNINDLTSWIDRGKHARTSQLTRSLAQPSPPANRKPHTPLHVDTPPTLRPQPPSEPSSHSPTTSATSDLVPSPASLDWPQRVGEDFELDPENSSSGSHTAESGSEDQEAALTDLSHDDSLEQIIEVSRERRDSGVGHSLTRATSDRRRKKIRWHSFQKSHRPDVVSQAMQVNSLTIGQLVRLHKLSLLRLTAIMEKFLPVNKSGWNWMMPRFMKRHKAPDFSDKNVFGVPLSVMAQRTGQPLPQCVLYAMRYLRRTCQDAVGIFRKSGVKSKIQQLRDHLEAHPDTTDFEGENAYNVADMLKTYFRDLPECLLTNKMSETFRSIYTYVPAPQRLEAIQAAICLLPDENREVLQSILLFLSDISAHEADHQMNASNLAVCFTPTVFHLGLRQTGPYSPKRNRKNSSGIPDPREMMEQKAAHECLLMMITECKKLFMVPASIFRQLQVPSLAHLEPTLPQDIGNCPADVRAFGQERIQLVLKESHDKNRGWLPSTTVCDVEIFHRKPLDECPLREWKLVVDIEAPPVEVLRRIMHERHTWDEDLLSWSVVERLGQHSDIFQYVLNTMAPHPPRNLCVLRYWRSDLNKGACALVTMSVEHSDALEIQGVWAIDMGTYFLIEPCGSGRSRLTHITRVDTRGRMPEWYSKIYGHICANFLDRLKESFKQDMSGPETRV